jgi:hypothetical protein
MRNKGNDIKEKGLRDMKGKRRREKRRNMRKQIKNVRFSQR